MDNLEIWIPIALAVISTAASAISAAFPDSKMGGIAKLINGLALNFGNAKNDPKQAR